MDSFDQKIDAVLRLLGRHVGVPATDYNEIDKPKQAVMRQDSKASVHENNTRHARSHQNQGRQEQVAKGFSMPALWEGIVSTVGRGKPESQETEAREAGTRASNRGVERGGAAIPMSAYLPVSYASKDAKQSITVQADLGLVSRANARDLASPASAAEEKQQQDADRGIASDFSDEQRRALSREGQVGRISSLPAVLVKVPWRAIRRKFWKQGRGVLVDPGADGCDACAECVGGDRRNGVLVMDTAFVLLVVDDALDGQSIKAHEWVGGRVAEEVGVEESSRGRQALIKMSPDQLCKASLAALGLADVGFDLGGTLRRGTMPHSDARHFVRYCFSSGTLHLDGF
jgi:hypothetical protein